MKHMKSLKELVSIISELYGITVTAKIELVVRAKMAGVPIISSMGTGNKLNPAIFEIEVFY